MGSFSQRGGIGSTAERDLALESQGRAQTWQHYAFHSLLLSMPKQLTRPTCNRLQTRLR